MTTRSWLLRGATLTAALLSALASTPAFAADDYKVDDDHSTVIFRIHHLGAGYVYGRFNQIEGDFSLDADPKKNTFNVTLKTDSVDTDHEKRDKHLRNADFFNAEEFPEITFTSKSVSKKSDTAWAVTGDLTLHGVTKQVTVDFERTGEGPDPWGGYRAGLEATFTIKRSDFGITHMAEGLGDEVRVIVALEGKKK
ncbi:MAG: YceI family protein [Alphaproteobacteria bacterium]|nr:YceI family protein [Alphaproteobacteria bacterium]